MKQFFTCLLRVLLCFWLFLTSTATYSQDNQPQTPLIPSPRQSFTPTPQSTRGYWNIDVVGDFTLPKNKSITFCGAGRNLHVNQDWQKLFRRGFSSIERSRMTTDEIAIDRRERISSQLKSNKADTWKSRLLPDQRALILYQNYFTEPPFNLPWARDSEFARTTYFQQPPGSPTPRESIGSAISELSGGCVAFNDCPFTGQINTFGKIYFDIENEGTSFSNRQEHANIYAYKMWALRKVISNYTEIGGIGPVPHNSYGYSRTSDFANTSSPDWLWSTTAQQINATNTRGRGMPDDIVGKSFGDLTDFQMPGTYFLSSDLDYSAPHNGDEDRHWLASLLGEQEVNMKITTKKRIAWQWLFNTQSTNPAEAARAEIPVQPVIAEGMGIFYWFTGAYGTIFWDDWNELTPNAPVVPGRENLDNNRHYACYEHYIHGLWRLFKHHGDLFNGQEKYLNEQTECSYDGGKSWYRLNSNALKRSGYAFARAIVNGDQILIAATQAYASSSQQSSLMVRYVQDGYRFYTTINLKGDEIYLGRGTMPKGTSEVIPSLTTLPVVGGGGSTTGPLAATVASYNCTTGAIVFGSTVANSGAVEFQTPGITGWTTNRAHTVEAGLRADPKPITIQIRQNGVDGAAYTFDFAAYCSSNSQPSTNTAPTIINPVSSQASVINAAYSLNIGNVFTDAQTPNALTLTAEGLPAGLRLTGSVISGTPTALGVSTVTLRAVDPSGLANTVSFVLTVNNTPPTGSVLSATVISYNCTTGGIVFGSTGNNNAPVEYSAVGITGWTTNQVFLIEAGLRADPKPITINVRQNGVQGTSFVFDLKAYCSFSPPPPVNTAPSVANAVGPQSATAGTGYSLNIGSVFTDSQTPTSLTLSVVGLPAGLSLAGTMITGTPSVSGNSTITLRATDPGSLTSSVNFVLTVYSAPPPPPNTAPTVLIGVGPQSSTVGVAYSLNVGGVFTDAQTPTGLKLTVAGLPAGLSLTGTVITGTPSVTGTSTITLRATDPGNLSSSVFFALTVKPQQTTTPPSATTSTPTNTSTVIECGSALNSIGQPLRVLGVDNIDCSTGSFRIVTEGGNGSAINYANLVGLSNASPNSCRRFLDNPDMIRSIMNPLSDIGNFQIRVTQGGVTSNTITFNFKQYCIRSNSRIANDVRDDLTVLVLGNPVLSDWVEVDVTAAHDEPVTFRIADAQGRIVTQHAVEASGETVRQRLWLGQASGVLLLQVNTPTRSKLIKLVRY